MGGLCNLSYCDRGEGRRRRSREGRGRPRFRFYSRQVVDRPYVRTTPYRQRHGRGDSGGEGGRAFARLVGRVPAEYPRCFPSARLLNASNAERRGRRPWAWTKSGGDRSNGASRRCTRDLVLAMLPIVRLIRRRVVGAKVHGMVVPCFSCL